MADQAPNTSRVHPASIRRILSKQVFAMVGHDVEAETGDEDSGRPSEDCR